MSYSNVIVNAKRGIPSFVRLRGVPLRDETRAATPAEHPRVAVPARGAVLPHRIPHDNLVHQLVCERCGMCLSLSTVCEQVPYVCNGPNLARSIWQSMRR
jgi:hypothetical protein